MTHVEGRASFPLPRLQRVLRCAASSPDLFRRYLRQDKHYSFILALPRDTQDELMYGLTQASECRASYLLRRAKSKSLQLERRNLRNSRAHMKGRNARLERPGRGKGGGESWLMFGESIDDMIDQSLMQSQDPLEERCATLAACRGNRTREKRWFLKQNKAAQERAYASWRFRSHPWLASSRPVLIQQSMIRIVPAVDDDTSELDGAEVTSHSVAFNCTKVAIPHIHRPDVSKLSVILLDGTDLLTNIEFSSDDSLAALQGRIVDAVGKWCDAVSSSGIVLAQNGHLTAGEVGLHDGDILTAVLPTNPSVRYNQLTIEQRIQEDIERVRGLMEDERHFRRVVERQFRILYNQNRRGVASPCTALIGSICKRVCVPAISSSSIINAMIAESSSHEPALSKEEFIKFFYQIMCSVVERLECDQRSVFGTAIPIARISDETWLRLKLQECAPGAVVFDCFAITRPRNRGRVRLSSSDASCQCFHIQIVSAWQPPRLVVADGLFRIQGHQVRFEWKEVATCDLVRVPKQVEGNTRERTGTCDFARKGQWKRSDVGDFKSCLLEEVDIRFLRIANEKHVDPWERHEVRIGLKTFQSPHCDVEF
eukprot:TRINITY_DN27288_c0_g2_i1.p1 TRINITY_DN27288_c0_g2~~TRINITY_DN27288_c0_g2_i1.p1  ORF type:complete len:598 (+),score=73.16 TRINITY_DN27288_c0_g2_i1:61-1854(+)